MPVRKLRRLDLLYAVALMGTSLGSFGAPGLLIGAYVLLLRAAVFLSPPRFRAILVTLVMGVGCLHLGRRAPQREPHPQALCMNNLMQIAMALTTYHDQYGCYPPAFFADDHGVPQHSWRVLLLPQLGEVALYDSYCFDEPWDGPHNRTLLAQRPQAYACPAHGCGHAEAASQTCYVAITGARTMWPGNASRVQNEVRDPLDATVLVVEASSPEIPWTRPQDLPLSDALPILTSVWPEQTDGHWSDGVFSRQFLGRHAAMVDGHVTFVPGGVSQELWRQLLQIDDGGDFSLDDVPTHVRTPRRIKINMGNCVRIGTWVAVALWPLPWVVAGQMRRGRQQVGRDLESQGEAAREEPDGT